MNRIKKIRLIEFVVIIGFFISITYHLLMHLVYKMNLFPYVSGDYKLLFIYIPLFMFINHQTLRKTDWIFCILWSLLLVPKNYFNLLSLPEANISVLINPVLMVAICAMVIMINVKENQVESYDTLPSLKLGARE
jgi:hypothetical protein